MAAPVIADAYISRCGSLIFCKVTSSNTNTLRSVLVNSGGQNYVNPTIVVNGGLAGAPATLGTPIVVSGQIVGVPVPYIGSGYFTSPTLSLLDPSGYGAVLTPVMGGVFEQIITTSGTPVVIAGGNQLNINPSSVWDTSVPFVCFQISGSVSPLTPCTWYAPPGMITTSDGGSLGVPSGTPLNNYSSVLEPYFIVPKTMPIGANFSYVPEAYNYSTVIPQADLSKRFYSPTGTTAVGNNFGNIVSWTGAAPYGYIWTYITGNDPSVGPTVAVTTTGTFTPAVIVPYVVSGVIQQFFVASQGAGYSTPTGVVTVVGGGGWGASGLANIVNYKVQSVTLLGGGSGYCNGVYTIQYDDTLPSGNYPTTNIIMKDYASSTNIVNLSGLYPFYSSSGVLNGGVLSGITSSWFVCYPPTQAGLNSDAVSLALTYIGGQSISGVNYNTAINLCCTGPEDFPQRNNPLLCSNDAVNLLKPINSKSVYAVRFVDAILGAAGISNCVNPGDMVSLQQFQWNSTPLVNISVTGIRPYLPVYSPYVYVNSPLVGSQSVNGYTNWAYLPTNDQWPDFNSDGGFLNMEVLTSGPHGLYTGQYTTFPNQTIPVFVTTGQVLSSHTNPQVANLKGLPSLGIYVTSPSSFVFAKYQNIIGTLTEPGYIGKVFNTAGSNNSIVSNSIQSVIVNSGGYNYASGLTFAIAPPNGAWQTALAYATISNGSVSTITPVIGYSGSNYSSSIPPVVTIAGPTTSYTTPTAVIGISGGQVFSPTIISAGGPYATGVIPAYVIGDGSGAAIFASGNGSLSTLSVLSGGQNYSWATPVFNAPFNQAMATAVVVSGSVTSYIITQTGGVYTTAPSVLVSPPSIPATFSVTLATGTVVNPVIICSGAGYTAGAPEVYIFGYGNNATAHAVMVGTSVSGIVIDTPGSGYTGPNPLLSYPFATTIGLPPQQAVAYTTLSASSVSSVSILYPGNGYSNSVPTTTLVGTGNGTGASLTTVMSYPFNFSFQLQPPGSIPVETAAAYVNSVGADVFWINIPHAATDALVTQIINKAIAGTNPNVKFLVELANEHWNNFYYFGDINNLGGFGYNSVANGFYTSRSAQVHNLAQSLLVAAGRNNNLIRFFGSQNSNPYSTYQIIQYANANNILVDAVGIAPYINCPTHITYRYAFASIVGSQPGSIANGTVWQNWPWTLDMAQDLFRHSIVDNLLVGGPSGYIAQNQAYLAGYTLGSTPKLVCYEGSLQILTPNPIDTAGTKFYYGLSQDMFYQRGMKDSFNAYLQMLQSANISYWLQYSLGHPYDQPLNYFLVSHQYQQPGVGDGSDGRSTNLFWSQSYSGVNAIIPNTNLGPFTSYMDRFNVSPSLLAFQNWVGTADPNVPVSVVTNTYVGPPIQFYGGTPYTITPAPGNPLHVLTGGTIFYASQKALQTQNVFPGPLGCLGLPYVATSQNNNNFAKPSITVETASSGTFSSMSKGKYILMTFNDKIAGIPTTVLRCPGYATRSSQNLEYGSVDTWHRSKVGGWYYLNGKLLGLSLSQDVIGSESNNTYSSPGTLVYNVGFPVVTSRNYPSRND